MSQSKPPQTLMFMVTEPCSPIHLWSQTPAPSDSVQYQHIHRVVLKSVNKWLNQAPESNQNGKSFSSTNSEAQQAALRAANLKKKLIQQGQLTPFCQRVGFTRMSLSIISSIKNLHYAQPLIYPCQNTDQEHMQIIQHDITPL